MNHLLEFTRDLFMKWHQLFEEESKSAVRKDIDYICIEFDLGSFVNEIFIFSHRTDITREVTEYVKFSIGLT